MSKDISGYYEGGHTEYKASDLASFDSRFLNVIRAVEYYLPRPSKVLDLGCGDMYFASQLPNHTVTGIDLDESKAKNILKHDLTKIPYPVPKAGFDGVICSEVLEHLWQPEDCLAEIARVVKPNGYAFITVPNFASLDAELAGHNHLLYRKDNTFAVEHIRQYSPGSLNTMIEAAGFQAVELRGNSPRLSKFFEFSGKALAAHLKIPQLEADAVLGKMFPAHLPGFLLVARRNA